MQEKFEQNNIFIKDEFGAESLRRALELKELDREMRPVLNEFFTIPLTTNQCCYGHVDRMVPPYLSYSEDAAKSENEIYFQKLFRENIDSLNDKINEALGQPLVTIELEDEAYGGSGPREYTLWFEIEKTAFQGYGDNVFETVWREFINYIHALKSKL